LVQVKIVPRHCCDACPLKKVAFFGAQGKESQMDLDLGGLWSWTVPLWGLFAIVFFLGGALTAPISLPQLTSMTGGGGGGGKLSKKHRA
jgi:hypothetical protein